VSYNCNLSNINNNTAQNKLQVRAGHLLYNEKLYNTGHTSSLLPSEMTYIVSSGALNSTHSLPCRANVLQKRTYPAVQPNIKCINLKNIAWQTEEHQSSVSLPVKAMNTGTSS